MTPIKYEKVWLTLSKPVDRTKGGFPQNLALFRLESFSLKERVSKIWIQQNGMEIFFLSQSQTFQFWSRDRFSEAAGVPINLSSCG